MDADNADTFADGTSEPNEPNDTFTTARLVAIAAVLCAVALIAGLFIGRATKTVTKAAGSEHSSVDVGFLRDMMVHHDQAVTIAATEMWNGESNSIRQEALDIILAQRGEYVQMAERLDGWGVDSADPDGKAMGWMGMSVNVDDMPGLATPAQIEELRNARGRESDRLFLELMIRHHRAGAEMASAAASNAKNDWVIATAVLMARTQETEIAEMRRFGALDGIDIPDPGVLMDMPANTQATTPSDTTVAHDMDGMDHGTSG